MDKWIERRHVVLKPAARWRRQDRRVVVVAKGQVIVALIQSLVARRVTISEGNYGIASVANATSPAVSFEYGSRAQLARPVTSRPVRNSDSEKTDITRSSVMQVVPVRPMRDARSERKTLQ